MSQEPVEVIQADREAAAQRLRPTSEHDPIVDTAGRIRRGAFDGHPWVQAFARHRIASEQSQASRIAVLEEALAEARDGEKRAVARIALASLQAGEAATVAGEGCAAVGWDHRYRPLKEGETILATDEVQRDDGSWIAAVCVGETAPDPNYTSHRIYRRLSATPPKPDQTAQGVRNAALREAANIVGSESGGTYSWLANRIRARITAPQPERTTDEKGERA